METGGEKTITGDWKKWQPMWPSEVTWKIANVPYKYLTSRKEISRQNVENVSWLLLRKEVRFQVEFKGNGKMLDWKYNILVSNPLSQCKIIKWWTGFKWKCEQGLRDTLLWRLFFVVVIWLVSLGLVLKVEPRTSCMLTTCSTTEPHPLFLSPITSES